MQRSSPVKDGQQQCGTLPIETKMQPKSQTRLPLSFPFFLHSPYSVFAHNSSIPWPSRRLVSNGYPAWMSMLKRAQAAKRVSLEPLVLFDKHGCGFPRTNRAKGPRTNSVEMITQLRNAGLNVVRMNFSHGSYEVTADLQTRQNSELTYAIMHSIINLS